MEQIKKMLEDLAASGLVNPKKYYSVGVEMSQHHSILNGAPQEVVPEISVYGASSKTGRNLLGTGNTFDAAMNELKHQWEHHDEL